MHDSIDVLEQRHSLHILLLVRDSPGIQVSKISVNNQGSTDQTKRKRIEELRENGLVEIVTGNKHEWAKKKVFLTPAGQEVASYVSKIAEVMNNLDKELDSNDGSE